MQLKKKYKEASLGKVG